MVQKALIMDEVAMNRAISRIAHEIIERNKGIEDVVLVGIQRRGVPLAQRLAGKIQEFEEQEIPVGVLDITLYRDDLSTLAEHPIINSTHIPFSVNKKIVVMVDDVLYTGRTARAAMDALIDLVQSIQFAVLIDRGTESADRAIMGKNVPPRKRDCTRSLTEADGYNNVIIAES